MVNFHWPNSVLTSGRLCTYETMLKRKRPDLSGRFHLSSADLDLEPSATNTITNSPAREPAPAPVTILMADVLNNYSKYDFFKKKSDCWKKFPGKLDFNTFNINGNAVDSRRILPLYTRDPEGCSIK